MAALAVLAIESCAALVAGPGVAIARCLALVAGRGRRAHEDGARRQGLAIDSRELRAAGRASRSRATLHSSQSPCARARRSSPSPRHQESWPAAMGSRQIGHVRVDGHGGRRTANGPRFAVHRWGRRSSATRMVGWASCLRRPLAGAGLCPRRAPAAPATRVSPVHRRQLERLRHARLQEPRFVGPQVFSIVLLRVACPTRQCCRRAPPLDVRKVSVGRVSGYAAHPTPAVRNRMVAAPAADCQSVGQRVGGRGSYIVCLVAGFVIVCSTALVARHSPASQCVRARRSSPSRRHQESRGALRWAGGRMRSRAALVAGHDRRPREHAARRQAFAIKNRESPRRRVS